MKQLLLLLFALITASSFAQLTQDTAKAQRCYELLHAKHSSDYFELESSLQWSEMSSHRDSSGKLVPYHFMSSFMQVDTNAVGASKYFTEITPEELKSYGLNFFSGREATHYELSLDGAPFLAYMTDSKADFVAGSIKYDSSFVADIQGIVLLDQSTKEVFCNGLTDVFLYDDFIRFGDCESGVTYLWDEESLTVMKRFQQECLSELGLPQKYIYNHFQYTFYFYKDRLKGYSWMKK